MTRIEFGPDGERLLAVQGGTLRIVDGGGATLRELVIQEPAAGTTFPYRDARWLGDGRIVGIDAQGRLHRFTLQLQPYEEDEAPVAKLYNLYDPIALNARASVYAAVELDSVRVVRKDAKTADTLWRGRRQAADSMTAAVTDDGELVVVAFQTFPSRIDNRSGRGWNAYDFVPVHTSTEPGYRRPPPTIVDRDWIELEAPPARQRVALSRTGRRLAVASPPGDADFPAVRLRTSIKPSDPPRAEPRTIAGGASAIAIDDRGVVVARAYPEGVAEQRLRIDYLAQSGRATVVAVEETIWFDTDLDDVVALGFDAGSRRIACLAASGRVEVLPVP